MIAARETVTGNVDVEKRWEDSRQVYCGIQLSNGLKSRSRVPVASRHLEGDLAPATLWNAWKEFSAASPVDIKPYRIGKHAI